MTVVCAIETTSFLRNNDMNWGAEGGFVLIIIPAIVECESYSYFAYTNYVLRNAPMYPDKDRKFLPLYDSVYRDGKDVTCAPIQIETEHLQAYISTFFCLVGYTSVSCSCPYLEPFKSHV